MVSPADVVLGFSVADECEELRGHWGDVLVLRGEEGSEEGVLILQRWKKERRTYSWCEV